jgi:hypothetical protein
MKKVYAKIFQSRRTRNDRRDRKYRADKTRDVDFSRTEAVRRVYDIIFSGLPMPKRAPVLKPGNAMWTGAGHRNIRERARRLYRPGPERRAWYAAQMAAGGR